MGAKELMDLKPGTRWASQVCDTDQSRDLSLDPAFAGGSLIGKRFADPESGLELLVTKAGTGTLAIDGVALPLKEAKPLPSSD
jgi:hypothetical protein